MEIVEYRISNRRILNNEVNNSPITQLKQSSNKFFKKKLKNL